MLSEIAKQRQAIESLTTQVPDQIQREALKSRPVSSKPKQAIGAYEKPEGNTLP